MREIILKVIDPTTVSSGTATTDTANKLVDTGADFVTDGVAVGDIAKNTTDGKQTIITAVDSATSLSLNNDYFPDGDEAYEIISESTQKLLDLYDPIVPKATFKFKDIQDLRQASAGYTETFRIPATPGNVSLFGNLNDPGLASSYETRKKRRAVLEVDTVPVFSGFLRLKSVIVQKGEFTEFEVTLFGEVANFGKDLGEAKFADLDLSDLDHDLTYANVTASWSDTLKSGQVVYGFADYGARFSLYPGSWRDISDPDYALDADHLKPCVQVTTLITKIFEFAGWAYTSSFIDTDTDFDKLFVPWVNHAGEKMLLGDDAVGDKLFWIGVAADQVKTISPAAFAHVAAAYDESTSPHFDAGGNVSSAGVYTAQATGPHVFEVNVPIKWSGSGTAPEVWLGIYDETAGAFIGPAVPVSPTTSYVTTTVTFTVPLTSADTISFRIQGDPSISGTSNVTIQGFTAGDVGEANAYWFRCNDAPAAALGSNVDMAAAAPDVKLIDFLQDLQKLFNWVFVYEPGGVGKTVEIEPFRDYIDAGDFVDWSEKLDVSKDYMITPAAEFQKRKVILTDLKDKDFYAQQVTGSEREDGERIYGEKIIDNSGNDFATGTELITTKALASTPMARVGNSVMVCPKYYDAEGAPIKPKLRILYWGGLETAGEGISWYMNNASDVATAQDEYPYMGHYETSNAGLDDYDLDFGVEVPFHFIAFTTYNTLYYNYWQRFLAETYSEDGRVLTAYFNLKPEDLVNMEWNDKILALGQEWRINKIIGYGVGVDEPVKVELVKLLSVHPCAWAPSSISAAGVVTMVDNNGTTGDGTKACCELYGYFWDAANDKCKQGKKVDLSNTPTVGGPDDPGTPFPPPGDGLQERRSYYPGKLEGLTDRGFRLYGGVGNLAKLGGGTHEAIGYQGNFIGGELPWVRHPGELTFGGGHMKAKSGVPGDEIQGRGQWGVVTLMGEDAITTDAGVVQLKVMGRTDGWEVDIPDDTVVACRLQLAYIMENTTTGANSGYGVYTFHFYIYNNGGTVTTTTSPVTKTTGEGTMSGCYKLKLTVTGSLVELALKGDSGCGAYTTHTHHVTASLFYTWARNREA